MKNVIYTLIFASFFLSCKRNTTKNTVAETPSKEYVIPLTLKERVYLEGVFKDTICRFLLDNGATRSSLSEAVFNHYYDVATLDTVASYKWDPKWFPAYVVPIHIQLKDYDFLIDTVMIYSNHPSKMSKESYRNTIGVELFMKNIIELNFEDSLMIIRSQLPENINDYQNFDLLNIQNITTSYDHLFRQIEIPGFYDREGNAFKGRFFVDLGSSLITTHKTIKGKTDVDLSKKDTATLAALILNSRYAAVDVIYQYYDSEWKIVEEITVNGQTMTVTDHTEYKFGDGTLGIPFLSMFHVIFDYPHSKLYLKRNNLKYE